MAHEIDLSTGKPAMAYVGAVIVAAEPDRANSEGVACWPGTCRPQSWLPGLPSGETL